MTHADDDSEARLRHRNDAGFTLVEILIAIVLVGVLAAVVVLGISSLTDKAGSAACTTSLDAARTSSVVYFTSTGTYPDSLLKMTSTSPPMLELPSGVLVNTAATGSRPAGTVATGRGWTLTISGGTATTPPTFTCDAIASAPAVGGTAACPGTYAGWVGEYYANRDLAGSATTCRDDSALSFKWGGGNPAPGLPADNFSIRWTRTFDLTAGTYTFSAGSDDGVRVFVDGTLVIDFWQPRSHNTSTGVRTLTAGNHVIIFEFYEANGDASADLSWTSVR